MLNAEADAIRVDGLMLEPLRKTGGKRCVDISQPGRPTGVKYVVESRDFAKPWAPRIREWSRANRIISTTFNAALNGEVSPRDAMTKVASEATAILPARR